VFKNRSDLVEQCRYFLNHPELRDRMARAGYERTLREHTYEQRFRAIFSAVVH
jgi:spore maturation protein CgeB